MIKSFADKSTKAFWDSGKSQGMPPANLRSVAKRKLATLHAAASLQDLRVPPGNHLEELHGNRKGQHSMRINDQFRLCFVWRDGDAYDVEIADYH
ncbi:MAG: type II toxin-antitoxin system RelE/ParE family toxin [Candidatus Sulfotelmatobacter sp.]